MPLILLFFNNYVYGFCVSPIIANHLKIDPDDVIVNKLHIRNSNYGSQSYSLDPEAITIFDEEQKEPRSISSYEIILARLPPDATDLVTIQVYVPPDGWNRQQEEPQIQDILLAP